MKNEHEMNDMQKSLQEPTAKTSDERPSQSEFKLTVRKLEIPVRPRGVLAE